MTVVKYSVIIPALNEEGSLPSLLRALRYQTIPREEFEIIVIDNGSSDHTAEVARHEGADRVLFEPEQGTNMARQRGFQESVGGVIAFIDADCIPGPQWLESLCHALDEDEEICAVSGPIDYGFNGFLEFFERLYTRRLFPHLDRILPLLFRKPAGIIMGGNVATRREALERIGGLPKVAFFGDDAATAILLSRCVGRVRFDPRICVRSSPRRFKEHGLLHTTATYARHYLSVYFRPLPPPKPPQCLPQSSDALVSP